MNVKVTKEIGRGALRLMCDQPGPGSDLDGVWMVWRSWGWLDPDSFADGDDCIAHFHTALAMVAAVAGVKP